MNLFQASLNLLWKKTKTLILVAALLFRQPLGPPKEVGMPWISTTHTVDEFEEENNNLTKTLASKCCSEVLFHSPGHQTSSFLPSQASIWTWHFTLCPGISMGLQEPNCDNSALDQRHLQLKALKMLFWHRTHFFHELATKIVAHENWNT